MVGLTVMDFTAGVLFMRTVVHAGRPLPVPNRSMTAGRHLGFAGRGYRTTLVLGETKIETTLNGVNWDAVDSSV